MIRFAMKVGLLITLMLKSLAYEVDKVCCIFFIDGKYAGA